MTTLNYSSAHETNFRLMFPILPFLSTDASIEKGDSILIYCKSANLPAISLAAIDILNPYVHSRQPTKDLTVDDFIITFVLDELCNNYKFFLNWIFAIKNPEEFGCNPSNKKVDATLHILSNNKNPKAEITLVNIFPLGISEIPFTYASESNEDLVVTARFSVDYFKMRD